jgi:hypothetical protein
MAFLNRMVVLNGVKISKIEFVPKKQKFKIRTCPRRQLLDFDEDVWKKYKGNKFTTVDGKRFNTSKEAKTYNKMFMPKVDI